MDKDLIYQRLGANIRRLRKGQGLTQAQLAERISRTEDAVSNIERGTSAPPPETAVAIAQALGVQLTDLYDLDLTGKPVPQDLKAFLVELRHDLSEMDDAKRERLYALFRDMLALVGKK